MNKAALLILAAFLFSTASCISWQTGERMRAAHEVYTGLDVNDPADGKIYHRPVSGLQLPRNCYVLAQEKTYQREVPPVKDVSGLQRQRKDEAYNLRPTGRVVPVMLRLDKKGNYVFERALTALPKGLVADDADISPLLTQARENARQEGNKQYILPAELGENGKPQITQLGAGRRVLIAGCDYVVDPVLSVISTPVVWGYMIATLPISVIELLSE